MLLLNKSKISKKKALRLKIKRLNLCFNKSRTRQAVRVCFICILSCFYFYYLPYFFASEIHDLYVEKNMINYLVSVVLIAVQNHQYALKINANNQLHLRD